MVSVASPPASPALSYAAHFHCLWSRSIVLLSLPRTGHVPSWHGAFAPATPSARSAFPGSLSGCKYLPIPLFKCHQEKPSPTHRLGLKVAIPTARPLFIAFQELTNVRSRQAVKARRATLVQSVAEWSLPRKYEQVNDNKNK